MLSDEEKRELVKSAPHRASLFARDVDSKQLDLSAGRGRCEAFGQSIQNGDVVFRS